MHCANRRKVPSQVKSIEINMLKKLLLMLLTGNLLFAAVASAKESGVSVQSGIYTLMGSLELPDRADKPPVVLIIAGSGPTDRDGNTIDLRNPAGGKRNTLRMLAEGLSEAGIASVRYDKRGVGASHLMSVPDILRFEDFVDDAVAWLNWLQQSGRFSKIIIMGHSEGALIGMLAAQRTEVQAFISLCGPADNVGDILQWQLSKKITAADSKANQLFLQQLKQGNLQAEPPFYLRDLYPVHVRGFLSSEMAYTPTAEIQKLKVPVLLIGGTHDIQVLPEQAQKLAKAQPGAQLTVIDGMNHVLKQSPEGELAQMPIYSNPLLPLAPELMPAVLSFIRQLP